MAGDSFTFVREYQRHTIKVKAHYIRAMETWGINVTVDGDMVDTFQSIDPWGEGRTAIDKHLVLLDLEAGGVPSGLLKPPLNETPHYGKEET